MSRAPAHITQADIARAIRAAKQAGWHKVEVRIDDRATIVIEEGNVDNKVSHKQNRGVVL